MPATLLKQQMLYNACAYAYTASKIPVLTRVCILMYMALLIKRREREKKIPALSKMICV